MPSPSPIVLIQDVLLAVRRKWRTGIGLVFCIGLLVAVHYGLTPRQYESEGKLYVQVGRGIVSEDRVSAAESNVSVVETRNSEVNSVIDIISSRGLAERIVDKIGVDRITESSSFLSAYIPSFAESKALTEDELKMNREQAIRFFMSNLFVHNPREAVTISVTCRLGSPELSQEVVRLLMEEYLQSHVAAHQTQGSFDFFDREYQSQKQKVEDIGGEIRDFKSEIGVMDIALRQRALQNQISQIEQGLVDASSDLASGEARIVELQQLIKNTPENIDAERTDGISNDASDRMREALFRVEIEYQTLLAKYTHDHLAVQRKREELDELRIIFEKQQAARSHTTTTKNPTRDSLQLDLMRAEADLRGQLARVDSYREEYRSAMADLTELNAQEVRLRELERALSLATQNLETYATKREESRMNLALDSEKISNVKVVQDATYVFKPKTPRFGRTAALGMILALTVGFAGVLIHHHLDPIYEEAGSTIAEESIRPDRQGSHARRREPRDDLAVEPVGNSATHRNSGLSHQSVPRMPG